MAVGRQPTVLMGAWGREKGRTFAATPLAKNLILIDGVWQRTIPMDQFHYSGSVLVLLFFWGGGGGGGGEQGEFNLNFIFF